jgi:hypothetical protein
MFPRRRAGAGQALVKIDAAGLNYIDVYFREGTYKAPLPSPSASGGRHSRGRRRQRDGSEGRRQNPVAGVPGACADSQ